MDALDLNCDMGVSFGDNPAAVAMAARVRERLEGAGIALRPMTAARL